MSHFNFPGNAVAVQVLASVSAANTAAATTTAIDMQGLGYDGPVAFVQNKGTGTGTLDGAIQDSADGSTGWTNVATFAQAGTGANVQVVAVDPNRVRRFVRYIGTIATGPHLVSVSMIGVRKLI